MAESNTVISAYTNECTDTYNSIALTIELCHNLAR